MIKFSVHEKNGRQEKMTAEFLSPVTNRDVSEECNGTSA